MKGLFCPTQPNKEWFYYAAFFLITVLITFPKFGSGIFIEKTELSNTAIFSDDIEYIKYVNFFKDVNNKELPNAPFSYRPLTPFLASFLPFEPRTAINIINIAALFFSTVVIFILAKNLFPGGIPLACALLHLISFNSFYYCATARVDSLSVLFITILLMLTLSRRVVLFCLCFVVGLLAKETIVISLLPFFVFNIKRSNLVKIFITIALLIVFFIAEQHVIRRCCSSGTSYFWIPTFGIFFENITRPRAIASFFLSLGLPGLMSLIFLIRECCLVVSNRLLLALYSGLFSSVALYFYALASAYADGRFIWICSPYICLISGFFLTKLKQDRLCEKRSDEANQ